MKAIIDKLIAEHPEATKKTLFGSDSRQMFRNLLDTNTIETPLNVINCIITYDSKSFVIISTDDFNT